jgi:hypothetical protein
MSGRGWIGITIGLAGVALLVAIAVAIRGLISKRSQATNEAISNSLSFVTETDEQILLAATLGGRLPRPNGGRILG